MSYWSYSFFREILKFAPNFLPLNCLTPMESEMAQADPAPEPSASSAPLRPLRAPAVDLEEIVDRFETPLLRYVGGILGPRMAEVQDVVQESFLRLHREFARVGPERIANIPGWLYHVAHNLAVNAGKRKEVERRAIDGIAAEEVDEQKDALDLLLRRTAGAKAMAELQELAPEQRQVVLLKVVHGLTLKEIAEITGTPIGTVDYRLHQGLRELARRLKTSGVI